MGREEVDRPLHWTVGVYFGGPMRVSVFVEFCACRGHALRKLEHHAEARRPCGNVSGARRAVREREKKKWLSEGKQVLQESHEVFLE